MGNTLSQIYVPTSADALAKAEQALMAGVHAKTPFRAHDVDVDSRPSPPSTVSSACDAAAAAPRRTIHTLSFEKESADRVLVMTHGFGAGVGVFYRNLPEIAATPGLTVHAVDWLGMGGSSRPPFVASTPEEAEDFFVESLELWRQRMGIERFVLCGHSLGGFLSAAYALRYPHRVTKLLLVSPVGVPERPDEPPMETRLRASRPMLASAIERMWNSNFTPQSIVRAAGHLGPSLVRWAVGKRFDLPLDEKALLENYLYHVTAAGCSGELAFNTILSFGAWARRPLATRLPQLRMPTTFFYGLYDWMDYHAAAAAQRKMIVPSKLITISGGGHQMYIEAPDEFNRELVTEILSAPLSPPAAVAAPAAAALALDKAALAATLAETVRETPLAQPVQA